MAIGLNNIWTDEPLWSNRLKVTSDGQSTYKPVGFVMDWANVTAVSGANVTLNDGQVIKIGEKYVRYGTILFKHTTGLYRVAVDTTTLVPGEVFVMQYTITDQDDTSPHFGGAIDGGRVYKDRILAGGASQPAWADVYAALPNLRYLD